MVKVIVKMFYFIFQINEGENTEKKTVQSTSLEKRSKK